MDLYDWRNQTPENFEELCTMILRDDPQLTDLRPRPHHFVFGIRVFPFADVEAIRLGRCLQRSTQLKSLSISLHPQISPRAATILASGIRRAKLNCLHVEIESDSNLVYDALGILYGEGVKKSETIRQISVSGEVRNFPALCQTIATLHKLELVGVDSLEPHGMQILSDSLRTTNSLTTITINSCPMTPAHMRILSAGLRHNSSITRLDVQFNELGDEGVIAFVKNWVVDSPIEEISFSANGLTVDGALILMQAAANHRSIRDLDLSCNEFGLDGMQEIAHLLPFVGLTKFDISGSTGRQSCYEYLEEELQMTAKETAQDMLRAIFHTPQLLDINMEYNCFPKALESELEIYLQLNKYGRSLLSQAAISAALWSHVLASCSTSPTTIYFFLMEQPHLVRSNTVRRGYFGTWQHSFGDILDVMGHFLCSKLHWIALISSCRVAVARMLDFASKLRFLSWSVAKTREREFRHSEVVTGDLLMQYDIPVGLWSHVLASCKRSPSSIYYFLHEQPHLIVTTAIGAPGATNQREDANVMDMMLECCLTEIPIIALIATWWNAISNNLSSWDCGRSISLKRPRNDGIFSV